MIQCPFFYLYWLNRFLFMRIYFTNLQFLIIGNFQHIMYIEIYREQLLSISQIINGEDIIVKIAFSYLFTCLTYLGVFLMTLVYP